MEETVWESHLTGRWGVARETLRETRQRVLEEGRDWRTVANRVVLTGEGVRKLQAALGIPVEDAENGQKAAPTAPASAGAAETGKGREKALGGDLLVGDGPFTGAVSEKNAAAARLRVMRLVRNPRVVLARRLDGGEVLRLRVRDNGKYRPGMEVPARQVQGDLYEVVGRGPRWVGKW